MIQLDRPLVIWHNACADGFCAAHCAAKALGDVELYAGVYGSEPPFMLAQNRNVYIVDFSYPRRELTRLNDVARSLLVLDHHKTAQKDLEGLSYCTFDMERSGAAIAWDHFHPGKERPWIVDYVQDRDLWKFELPNSEAVSLFIRTCDYNLEAWDALASMKLEEVLEQAKGCQRYLKHYIQDAIRNVRIMNLEWGDQTTEVATLNLSYTGVSDVLHVLLEKTGAPIALGWHLLKDGLVFCSLRSRADVDCSVMAKALGGGGHAQASGMRLSRYHPVARQLLRGEADAESWRTL